jgi:NADH:ubiquinone oxidoreductase subunit C
MKLDAIVSLLKTKHGAKPLDPSLDTSRKLFILKSAQLLSAVQSIRAEWGEDCRLLFAAASYVEDVLVWIVEIESVEGFLSLRVEAEDGAAIPSLASEWPYADWQEKEAHELFGLQFQSGMDFEPFLVRNARIQFPHRRQ